MKKNRIIRLIPLTVMALTIIAMAVGTFIEKAEGPVVAADKVYHTLWFALLWALFFVASAVVIAQAKLIRRPLTFGIHLAFGLILIGALLTTLTGQKHRLELAPGETNSELPFSITLEEFEIVHHSGTQAPQNFVSHLTIGDATGGQTPMDVSMNHIGRYQGYRLYMTGYDEGGSGAVVLTATHDPWGIGVTYTGYILLLLSFIGFFFEKNSHFRQLLKSPLLKQGTALMLLLLVACGGARAKESLPPTLSRQSADLLGHSYVLYQDRVCPLQTLARDVSTKLYGNPSYHGLTAEQVLSGWMFFPAQWMEVPTKGGKHLQEQQELQMMLMSGTLYKIYPVRDSAGALAWYSPGDHLPMTIGEEEFIFIRQHLRYCTELAFNSDFATLDTVLNKLTRYQEKRLGAELPSAARTGAERAWNHLSRTKPVAMACTTLGLLFFAYMVYCLGAQRRPRRWTTTTGTIITVGLSLYLLLLFVLRWEAQGFIPLTNGYETMCFLALCLAVLAWAAQGKITLSLPCGMLMAGLALMVAMMSGSNPAMTQMAPVLDSPLLCIHVAVIMLSYTLLAFVMLMGIAALIGGRELQERLQVVSLIMLYPAVFLLAVGIFIGAVWANVSWGTYWSWDPKEVWALITLIVYGLLLHGQSLPALQKPRTYHWYAVLAFLCVLVTYFGVNLVLGGMHSYA